MNKGLEYIRKKNELNIKRGTQITHDGYTGRVVRGQDGQLVVKFERFNGLWLVKPKDVTIKQNRRPILFGQIPIKSLGLTPSSEPLRINTYGLWMDKSGNYCATDCHHLSAGAIRRRARDFCTSKGSELANFSRDIQCPYNFLYRLGFVRVVIGSCYLYTQQDGRRTPAQNRKLKEIAESFDLEFD